MLQLSLCMMGFCNTPTVLSSQSTDMWYTMYVDNSISFDTCASVDQPMGSSVRHPSRWVDPDARSVSANFITYTEDIPLSAGYE